MRITERFTIPFRGHILQLQTETLPAYEAYLETIKCKERALFTQKIGEGMLIDVCKYSLECPKCHEKFIASNCTRGIYGNELEIPDEAETEKCNNSDSEFSDWALQYTLPGLESNRQRFEFRREFDSSVRYPKCCFSTNVISETKCENFSVEIDESCTLITQNGDKYVFQLIFDHSCNKTFCMIIKGGEMAIEDITEKLEPLEGSLVERF